jgi:L-seryl-tRNA(Ser) seleniumtransferase
MLGVSAAALERRARALAVAIGRQVPGVTTSVEPGTGEVGGGALPLQRLPGWVVALEHAERTAVELERWARTAEPPVIGYIRTGKFRMDVRTLRDDEIDELAETLGRTPWPESTAPLRGVAERE